MCVCVICEGCVICEESIMNGVAHYHILAQSTRLFISTLSRH